MALDQSALLELLDALKSADADDVVRRSVEAVFQALIEAQRVSGSAGHDRGRGRRAADSEARYVRCQVVVWAWIIARRAYASRR